MPRLTTIAGIGVVLIAAIAYKGKPLVSLVTGANVGLGLQTSLQLARQGSKVVMTCRSEAKCNAAVDTIRAEVPGADLVPMTLDLMSLQSVADFVAQYKATGLPLHTLVANAGRMICPFELSADGIESQFAINHVGHFGLVLGLLDIVKASTPSRIVVVSSDAHKYVGLPDDLDHISKEELYGTVAAYGVSKTANILFARKLASLLEGEDVYVNAAHPGFVNTDLGRHVGTVYGDLITSPFKAIQNALAFTVEDGALTQLYLATSPEVVEDNIRGQYYRPIAVQVEPAAHATDDAVADKLWEWSLGIIAPYDIPHPFAVAAE